MKTSFLTWTDMCSYTAGDNIGKRGVTTSWCNLGNEDYVPSLEFEPLKIRFRLRNALLSNEISTVWYLH